MRFKGNSTFSSTQGLKKPFKLDFNHYVEGQKLHGLTSVSLGNNAFDPSQLRESLGYWVYQNAGIPSPRTAFVKLYLTVDGKHDKEFVGLYTMIEPVNKAFLRDRFKSAKGLLLKPEKVPGLAYLGEDWKKYEERYQPKTDAKPEAKKRLIAFAKLVQQADDKTFRKEIDNYLDIDEFLRYLAATSLQANLDSFVGLGHNYFLYLQPENNKFLILPWDLNMTFAGLFMGGNAEQQTQWSIDKPYMGQNKLIQRVLAMDEHKEAYRKHLKTMTTTFFTQEKLNAEIDRLNAAVKHVLALEAKKSGPKFGFGGKGPMGLGAPDLKTFIGKRVESVALQLEGKQKGFEVAGGFGGPGGGKGGFMFGPGQFLAEPILKAADTNKDGKLSKAEFVGWHKQLFADCDVEKTGAIDEKSLAAALDKLLPEPPGFPGGKPFPGGQPPPGPDGKPFPGGFKIFVKPGTQLAGALMRRADPDIKGKADQAAFLKTAESLFVEADKNKDGFVDQKELADALNKLMPPPKGFGPPGGGGFPPAGEAPFPPPAPGLLPAPQEQPPALQPRKEEKR